MPKAVVCTLYHNPRCSKSRATLALLRQQGIEPTVVDYLQNPPSAAELKAILRKLALNARQIVRKSEELYKTKWAAKDSTDPYLTGAHLTDAQWIDILVDNPILIERPIVVMGGRAALGRPPENVLQLFRNDSTQAKSE